MTDTLTLRMERAYRASARAVFDAWTSEEVMRRWWHAGRDWETSEAEVDLRVGGAGGCPVAALELEDGGPPAPSAPAAGGAFGAICRDRRRNRREGHVPAEQAVTRVERPLPARVQEALGELVGAAQEGLLALWWASGSACSPS